MGIFRAAHRWRGGGGGEGGGKKDPPAHKICHIYPTTMKLGTVIPYLKKIKKNYESSDTPPDLCCIFSREIIKFVISRNADIDCISVHNF